MEAALTAGASLEASAALAWSLEGFTVLKAAEAVLQPYCHTAATLTVYSSH